jgi:hypothetical protein
MKNLIVAFHIGRGGRFNNSGFKSFLGEKSIDEFTDDLFIHRKNETDLHKLVFLKGRPNLEKKFNEARDSGDWSFFENRLKFNIGKEVYFDECGNEVGLTVKESSEGTGSINLDNDFDTTYACKIEDCGDEEIKLIRNYDGFISSKLDEYLSNL